MPTAIEAVLTDLNASVYHVRHKLIKDLEINKDNKRNYEARKIALSNRINNYHSESYQEHKEDPKKDMRSLKKDRSNFEKKINLRIKALDMEIKQLAKRESDIYRKVELLKQMISNFRKKQIEPMLR